MNKYFGWMFALIASMTMVSAYAEEADCSCDEVAVAEEVAVEDEVVANEEEVAAEEDSSVEEDQVVATNDDNQEDE